jgi:hypothetical protein
MHFHQFFTSNFVFVVLGAGRHGTTLHVVSVKLRDPLLTEGERIRGVSTKLVSNRVAGNIFVNN